MEPMMEGHFLLATAIRQGPPLSEEELKQVDGNVQSLYASGAPYFTRQTLHRIGQEIEQAAKDNKPRVISVAGLDGVTVEFEVKIETADMAAQEHHEYFAETACLLYQTPAQLAMFSGNNPVTAYSNIQVMLKMVSLSSVQSNMDLLNQRSRGELDEILIHNRQKWEASEQCKRLKHILAQRIDLESVGKIIGFGLGALFERGIQSYASASAHQHALLLTLRETLSKSQRQRCIPCYVQDPAYSVLDKAILRDSGFTVVEDPNGFVEVDEDSAVISLFPDCPVKEIVFNLAKPALIIWKTVEHNQDEASSSTSQHAPAATPSVYVFLLPLSTLTH
ncbi:SRR1 domain-containing protein [Sarocladium implicatum]|nr:SRR1 domain-containing protein [Sarocladium implicatum]